MFGATVGGFGGGFSNDNLSSFCMCGFFGAKSGMPRGDFFFIALNLRLSQIVRPAICNHSDRDRYDDVPGNAPAAQSICSPAPTAACSSHASRRLTRFLYGSRYV